jgi:hypothetical protein
LPDFVPEMDEILERNRAYSNGEKKKRRELSDLVLLTIRSVYMLSGFVLHGKLIFIWRREFLKY